MVRLTPRFTVVRKVLALSGNQCAFPDCNNPLIIDDTFVGELAHIYAAEEGGPRYSPDMSDEDRRGFSNLMYLCGHHHTIVDKRELLNKYPAEWMLDVKAKHENANEAVRYSVSDDVLEQAMEEINIVQANVLMNGNQTNIQQNFFNEAAANASRALSQVIEQTSENDIQQSDTQESLEIEEGLLDRMAEAEVTIPLWTKTIDDMTVEIKKITPVMNQGIEDLSHSDKMKKGISGRRHVFRKTASRLDPIAAKIEILGNAYESQFKAVNSGINAMLDTAELNPEKAEELDEFFSIMRGVVRSSVEGLEPIRGMLEQMDIPEKMSSDMRRTLAKVRKGLVPMIESKVKITEWAVRIDRLTAG